MSHKAALIGALMALGLPSAALAQSDNPVITVIGAVNDPAHIQPAAARDAAVPEMPVVYDQSEHNAAQAQTTANTPQPAERTASAERTNLNQAVKSH